VLHQEQGDILVLEPLQVQVVIQGQEPLLVLVDILEDNRELLEVDILEVNNRELLVVDILVLELLQVQEVIQEQEPLQVQVDILEANKELLVEDILEQELHLDNMEVEHPLQVNLEEPPLPKWTLRLPSGSKQWTRITVARLMLQNWGRLWPTET